jgi:hypothetical protein
MKNLKVFFPTALLLGLLWLSCHKDDSLNNGTEVAVTFAGQVLDDDRQPIPGARVSAGGQETVTNYQGVFRLEADRMPARNAVLNITHPEFFEFSRGFSLKNGAVQPGTYRLIRKSDPVWLNAATGGIVQNGFGGPILNFPAGSVVRSDGQPYQGSMLVYMRHLNPSTDDLALLMPGDLRGLSLDGQEQTLATFGMLAVELRAPDNSALQIALGHEVELRMPIPSGKLAAAPAEIALWWYDLEQARWIEEGKAQKVGNRYVGNVKHFSFWNCDAGFPLVHLEGKVVIRNEQQPLANGCITLSILSSGYESYGWTDLEGNFSGSIPQNEALQLTIKDYCGVEVFTQTIGPFSADATLPTIVLGNDQQNLNWITLNGRLVDCNQQPLTSGYVVYKLVEDAPTGTESMIFLNSDGEFNITITACSATGLMVTGFDMANFLQGSPLNVDFANYMEDLGDIGVCNDLDEYIKVEVDGALSVKPFPIAIPENGYISIFSYFGGYTRLYFENNNQTGTFPLIELAVNGIDSTVTVNVQTTLTTYGNVGEHVIGTFEGTFQNSTGPVHAVNGSYRVRREQ